MKRQLKRRFLILIAVLFAVSSFSALLNRASFESGFSLIDAVSSATKRSGSRSSGSDAGDGWGYSTSDLVLPDDAPYRETVIMAGSDRYVMLEKTDLPSRVLVILSDKNNSDYAAAVRKAAEYYQEAGFTVEVREYSETMMLSLAHAEHFDLFLLREEEET